MKSLAATSLLGLLAVVQSLSTLFICIASTHAFAPLPRNVNVHSVGRISQQRSTLARQQQKHGATSDDDNNNNDEAAPAVQTRETELGRMSQGIARTGMKDVGDLRVGDVVVAKYEVPSLDIWIDAGYEIVELYSQGVNSETGMVEKIPLQSFDDDNQDNKVGYTRYLKVYSPKYHSEPVIVTPEEMGLATLKAELVEALWLAVPGFFWIFLCITFASNYNSKYGGNFLDAFFRT
jgi:hypothetical protein